MLKFILILAFTFTAVTSFAENHRCSCQQDFQDVFGTISQITVHVYCPVGSDEYDLECSSKITPNSFSATCSNTESGEQSTTTINLDPTSKPTYGYTGCELFN